MADRAVELLLRALDGEAIETTRLPTAFVPRTSCGCTDFATASPPTTTPEGRELLAEQFADRRHLRSLISTQYTLNTALLYNRDTDPRDPSWLAATPAARGGDRAARPGRPG